MRWLKFVMLVFLFHGPLFGECIFLDRPLYNPDDPSTYEYKNHIPNVHFSIYEEHVYYEPLPPTAFSPEEAYSPPEPPIEQTPDTPTTLPNTSTGITRPQQSSSNGYFQKINFSGESYHEGKKSFNKLCALQRAETISRLIILNEVARTPTNILFQNLAKFPDDFLFNSHVLYAHQPFFEYLESRPRFNDYLISFSEKLKSHSERKKYRSMPGFYLASTWRALKGWHHESEFINFINAHADGAKERIFIDRAIPQLTYDAQHIIDSYGNYEIFEELGPAARNALTAAQGETNTEIKSNLFKAGNYFIKASKGLIKLVEKTGSAITEVATRVVKEQVTRKVQFVQDLFDNPTDAVYKSFIEPVELAGYCLGKAAWLACTAPERLMRAGFRTADAFVTYAQEDPLGIIVAFVDMCIDRRLPNAGTAIGAVCRAPKRALQGATAMAQKTKTARTAGEKIVDAATSKEIIHDRVATFEQARNAALRSLGPLGPGSKPNYGRFGDGKVKIVGRVSANKQRRWRLEWDEKKGPHINVDNFQLERGQKKSFPLKEVKIP